MEVRIRRIQQGSGCLGFAFDPVVLQKNKHPARGMFGLKFKVWAEELQIGFRVASLR